MGLGKNFLNMTSKAQVVKDKDDNMDFNRIKTSGAAHDIKHVKDNPKNGRRYLQIMYLTRILHPEYIKNSYNSIIKTQITLLKSGQRI